MTPSSGPNKEGFFGRSLFEKCSLGFSGHGVFSGAVMLPGCKPAAKSLSCGTSSTDQPFQKKPFSRAVPGHVCVCVCVCVCVRGLLRTLGRANSCTNFRRKCFRTFRRISSMFPSNFCNVHWRSRIDLPRNLRIFFTSFPQLLEVQFEVRGGGGCVHWVCGSTYLQRADWKVAHCRATWSQSRSFHSDSIDNWLWQESKTHNCKSMAISIAEAR